MTDLTGDNSSLPQKQPQQNKANPRNFRPAGAASAVKKAPTNTAPSRPPQNKPKEGVKPTNNAVEENQVKGLGAVVIRNEFYRDGYRNMLRVVVAQTVVIIMLVCSIFYVIHIHQPENRYFATTEDGRLVPMVAMSQANLSKPALMSWVAQSVSEVMTFGFSDYRRRLQEASRNFTKRGWDSFTQALDRSGILDAVKENRQVLTTIPSGAPVLQEEGMDATGRYFWRVEIPISVTYEAGSRRKSDRLIVRLVIVRVPRLESPYGIGIEQWLASDA